MQLAELKKARSWPIARRRGAHFKSEENLRATNIIENTRSIFLQLVTSYVWDIFTLSMYNKFSVCAIYHLPFTYTLLLCCVYAPAMSYDISNQIVQKSHNSLMFIERLPITSTFYQPPINLSRSVIYSAYLPQWFLNNKSRQTFIAYTLSPTIIIETIFLLSVRGKVFGFMTRM
jgi:hypothetical protein